LPPARVAATGALDGWLLFLLLAGAAILGNTVNYSIGHFIGPRVFRADETHPLLNRQHLDRAHAFFEKYGGMAVVLTRFVPIIRTFVPFVAGAGAMRYTAFALFNVLGGVLGLESVLVQATRSATFRSSRTTSRSSPLALWPCRSSRWWSNGCDTEKKGRSK
jgi:membrane protein DedA with SNARE-associated domain